MLQDIWAIIKFLWVIIKNTYLLAFIITGMIMWVARKLGNFRFGKAGGVILYAIVAFILNAIF